MHMRWNVSYMQSDKVVIGSVIKSPVADNV